MTRALLVLAAIVAVATSAAGAQNAFPSHIDLPDGFQPEGIAIAGDQFYVGSIPTGRVYRGSLRTGQGAELVTPPAGPAAIGMKVDRGRLFVAGGPTGDAFVYNAKTGATIASYELPTSGATFVNDVVVTKRAAWFTDSQRAVLYRLPLGPNGRPGAASSITQVPLGGDYAQVGGFNVNGIDATPNGKTLVFVQSATGRLFTTGANGVARAITLANGESVPNGDGILLDGKTLYVVQNQLNRIAKIALGSKLTSGRVLRRIESTDFSVPTTIAEHGSNLYAVNARFGITTTDYWVTKVEK
ncbi:MAG: superoxide dismutase [Actinobacteria bacterium]|nr:superoxide dismutase [Actinomycetota bacterium]